jgi:putative nucleotidyltransferase with HDIG domain
VSEGARPLPESIESPADEGDTRVSCASSRSVIEYILRNRPEKLSELFDRLPLPWREMKEPEKFFADEKNRIPGPVLAGLFEQARAITGNPNAPFEIGFDSTLHRGFGRWRRPFFRIFHTPQTALRRLNTSDAGLDGTKIVEIVYSAPGRSVIRWHWREGVVSSKDICSYNKGIYSALPALLGFPAGTVEEGACAFDGEPWCEITLTWKPIWWRVDGLLSRLPTRKSTLYSAIHEIDRDKTLLRRKFDELAAVNRELGQKVTMLKSINSATRAIVSVADTQKILEQTMTPIVTVFGFDRAMIMMVDALGENLEYRYSVGEPPDSMSRLKDYRIPLSHGQNLMVRTLNTGVPQRVRDVTEAGLNPANRILADFRPRSFIVCPLIADGKAIGVLAADRKGRQVSADDEELLSIFANNIAIAFQRTRLDEEVKSSYESSVRALVQAIEEKDPYTRGHSERVAAIVEQVARELEICEREVEYLRFGSILHDIGKIGIPEAIVRSPKPLTDAEFRIIQKHPLKGVEILQPISFIRDHMHLIRNHHERWDGKGYPDQLAGDAIPLGAQIVAVADAFDAMTTSRPYRRGLPHTHAAREIRRHSGTQFSPKVADAFILVLERGAVPAPSQALDPMDVPTRSSHATSSTDTTARGSE